MNVHEKLTVAGHVYTILDENLNVCSGPRTGMWINNKYYPVNNYNEVIIPYVAKPQNLQGVVIHEDFADLVSLKLLKEDYNFTCAYLYSTESMLMSSKAKILIQPRLYVNNVPASFQLIKEPLVTVTITNEHDIPSTLTFDKVKFDRNEEVELEFPIAAKLKLIQVVVTAKLDTIHSRQDETKETS